METLRSCEVYDLADGVWAESAPLNVARAGAGRGVLCKGGHFALSPSLSLSLQW